MKHLRQPLWLLAVLGCSGLGCSGAQHDKAIVESARVPALAMPPKSAPAAQVPVAPFAPAAPVAAPLQVDLLASLPPASQSTSIGSPTNGRLEGGVPLPLAGPGFRHNDRRSREARYGTVELVRAIIRAAAVVERELPGGELSVNDLGLPRGGPISHHGSHRAGRDADVLFYLLDDAGRPRASIGAPIEPSGKGFDYGDLTRPDDDTRVHFDAPRTWRFVRALLEDEQSEVQRIFVVEHVRALLLAEADRSHAPQAIVARFADVSCQPGYPHDDHLHVRWFCSFEDLAAGCEDAAPIYPWREAQLRAAGSAPKLARRTRAAEPPDVVTNAEAEREVLRQQPHADVLAFLQRRKTWEKQPHPGRPYCR
jgi:penicillin-insensitive murein DD-endopeptidase